MSTTEMPRGESGPRYVRLQAELVLEVTGTDDLGASALSRIEADTFMPERERVHAEAAVGEDESEALAYLVDPADLVAGIPGIELVQASWSCAHTEYDPASQEWALGTDEDFTDDFTDDFAEDFADGFTGDDLAEDDLADDDADDDFAEPDAQGARDTRNARTDDHPEPGQDRP